LKLQFSPASPDPQFWFFAVSMTRSAPSGSPCNALVV
jgi:hypothetical protein